MNEDFAFHRRTFLSVAGALTAGLVLPSQAQMPSFPKGPVRFVVPASAGGIADATTRPLVIELERSLKQPVIVENKPGGLFLIGMQSVLQAPPDGHTLLYVLNSMACVQAVHGRFDMNQQLTPIGQTTAFPMVLIVAGNSRFKNARELVAYARANPGKLSYASSGAGSTEHLKTLEFEKREGFRAVNVPYKSGPEMARALMGGDVDFELTAVGFAHAFAPKGLVKVLAVLDDGRVKGLPDVPTAAEAGISLSPLVYWGGYAVRAGTPRPIVDRLHQEVTAAAMTPAVRDRLAAAGLPTVVSKTPEEFGKVIAQTVTWAAEHSKGQDLHKAS